MGGSKLMRTPPAQILGGHDPLDPPLVTPLNMGWKGSEDGSWGGGSSWRDGWIGILRNLKARFQ